MKKIELYRLTYVSRPVLTGGRNQMHVEVDRILQASRRNNARVLVTGALLFTADCFAQTLEGGLNAVQEVFERIQGDPRHADPVVLQAAPIAHRDFADWSMAYAGYTDDERLRFDALTGQEDREQPAAGAEKVLSLLRGVIVRAAPALA